jgi:hypothetical protein
MSDREAVEATRREFDAVMAQTRFATIEQVAADLAGLADDGPRRLPATEPGPMGSANAVGTGLPSRRSSA